MFCHCDIFTLYTQAASVQDAENGMKFMQEMIELSSKQPQDGKSIVICVVFFYLYYFCQVL